VWAGVDSVWEQENLEATLREMLAVGSTLPVLSLSKGQAARPVSEAKRGARFVGQPAHQPEPLLKK